MQNCRRSFENDLTASIVFSGLTISAFYVKNSFLFQFFKYRNTLFRALCVCMASIQPKNLPMKSIYVYTCAISFYVKKKENWINYPHSVFSKQKRIFS